MFRTRSEYWRVLFLALMLALPFSAAAQDDKAKKEKKVPTGKPVFWVAPSDVGSLNLLLGAGGEEMKPDISKVTFVKDRPGGYSKKYEVTDAKGNRWIAKISKESQPDTAANRLVWALGYPSEIAYLVPKLKIEGKGEFENVRLEARPKGVDRVGNWMWESNPFQDTQEFRGLKIFMAMINNWDMKDDNNEILEMRNPTTGEAELRYIISDLGGTFGKTGGFFSRSRNEPKDFVKADFIKAVKGDVIDFNYGGKNQKLFEGITVADARWLNERFKGLSDEQLKDAFRAANYTPEEVDMLTAALKARIAALANPAGAVAKDN